VEKYYDWYQEGRKPNNPEGRAHYLGQLHYLDTEIGRLMDYLNTLELADNTIVIYIGDNGGSTPIYANNEPLRGSKYLLYQGGVKIPMLISYPKKIKKEQVLNNTVSNMDVLPTICSAVGIPIPDNIDGINLMPLLEGKNNNIGHDTLYWDTGHERAIKVNNWKWHEATNDRSAKYEMVELELGQFLRNLDADIAETKNFEQENPEKVAALKSKLTEWQAAIKKDIASADKKLLD
jgi:arylsulfatase A-like enzyme